MYRHLTRLRLRWYALATGRILLRHWQLVVIACLFVPANIPVDAMLFVLAYPLMAVLNIGHDVIWHIVWIALIQLAALIWMRVQQDNIAGGRFARYLHTLPVSSNLRRRVDLSVLLFANGILLLPVIALASIAPTRLVPAADKGFLLATVCVLVALVHLAQLAALERRRAAYIAFALSDLLLSTSLSRPVDAASWLALVAALPCAATTMLPHFTQRAPHRHAPVLNLTAQSLFTHLPPVWSIQAKALWMANPASSAARMAATLLLALGADELISLFDYDGRALPTVILCMGAIALIVSGLYRVLQTLHQPMQAYLASLPLHRNFWLFRDTASVFLFGAVPLTVLLVPMLKHTAIATVLAITTAYFGLLALMRLPLAYGGRQTTLLSVMLAGIWSGATMVAIF